MQKISFSILINAPKEKVWDTMLNQETYQQWTKAFNGSSHYEGSWEEGSEIRFIGTSDDGATQDGMASRIAANRPYEFISIEHLGFIRNGVVDTTSDEVKKWTPAFENYTLIEETAGTKVVVEMDIADEFKDAFNDMWPKALQLLKELAEK